MIEAHKMHNTKQNNNYKKTRCIETKKYCFKNVNYLTTWDTFASKRY